MLQNTLVLFDYSNVMHRSRAVNSSLYDYNDVFTGGLYGFISQFCHVVNKYKPSSVVLCQDRKPYYRSEEYAAYGTFKKNRGSHYTEDEKIAISEQLEDTNKLLRELIDTFNIPEIYQQGIEADDFLAAFVEVYHNQFDRIILVSNDDDLYQLLQYKNVFIYKKKELYGRESFIKDFDIDPKMWIDVTAMTGTHNSLDGIPKVGVKTAIKLLTNKGRKLLEITDKYQDLINRNKKLIKLPHEFVDYNKVKTTDIRLHSFNERQLQKFLDKYDISITGPMIDAFEWLAVRSYKHI